MKDARLLNTPEVWDSETTVYSGILDELFELLDQLGLLGELERPVRILAPAIGTGRFVKDFLQHSRLPEVEIQAVEPDTEKTQKFEDWLANNDWKRSEEAGPPKYMKGGSSIAIIPQRIEAFLTGKQVEDNYDIIFCLLFFHYIPDCFISVLRKLYLLLSDEGLFVVDQLKGAVGTDEDGKDYDDRQLLQCIDSHVDKLSSLSDYDEDCCKWRDFYLKRLREERAFWASAVKATRPDLVLETLKPLFTICESVESGVDRFELKEEHLPWMWAHEQGKKDMQSRELEEDFRSLRKEFRACLEVHFFAKKKTGVASKEHWRILKQKSRIEVNDALNSILWFVEKGKDIRHSEIKELHHHVIPAVIMQLIASSGIFHYCNQISSVFLATGSSPYAFQDIELEGVHILNNSKGDETESREQAEYWSINHHIFANVLKQPLSSAFINSGLNFALGIELKEDVKGLLEEKGYETLSIPSKNTSPLEGVSASPKIQILVSSDLLSIDQSDSHPTYKLDPDNECTVGSWVEGSGETNVDNLRQQLSDLNNRLAGRSGFERDPKDLIPANLLIQKLGTTLFVPIPGYFERDGENHSVGAILGLGFTLRSVNEGTIDEVNDVLHIGESLIRRFHDKYLSMKWMGDAREAALRSAISTIMARNFAHNIGSHVAINAANRKVRVRIDELYQGDLDSTGAQAVGWLDYMTDRLNQYQIHRNEYLADFQNQSPIPMRLHRDLVLDFAENAILMDNLAKSERICFERNGNCVRNRLKIRTFIGGDEVRGHYPSAQDTGACGEDIVYPNAFSYVLQGKQQADGGGNADDIDEAFNDKQIRWAAGPNGRGEPDVEVLVPNPHAFYSILENFIRNSAKHCEDKLRNANNGWSDDLEVYVSVKEEDESYRITLHDNVSLIDVEKPLRFQKEAIEGSLLDKDMEPTRKNSGIADMKVNAFLLSMPSEALSDETLKEKMDVVVCSEDCGTPAERDFQLLREFELPKKEGEGESDDDLGIPRALKKKVGERGYFGYQFRLLKPKKVCWIGPHDTNLNATPEDLQKEGLAFHEDPGTYLEMSQGASLASYDFAVLREEAVRAWLENGEREEAQARLDQLLLALPCRALLVKAEGDAPRPDVDVFAEAIRQRRVVEVVGEETLLARDDGKVVPAEIANRLLRRCWHAWLSRWRVTEENKAHGYVYALDEDTVEAWSWHEEEFPVNLGPVDFSVVSEDDTEKDKKGKITDGTVEIPDDGRLVVYDRHGKIKPVVKGSAFRKKVAPRLRGRDFYGLFDKNSSDFARINYPPGSPELREVLAYKLIEAGLLQVLIVDERVADLNERRIHDQSTYITDGEHQLIAEGWESPKFWHQALGSNVFIATHLQIGQKEVQPVGGSDEERLTVELSTDKEGEAGKVSVKGSGEVEIGEDPFDIAVIHRTRFVEMRDGIARPDEDDDEAAVRLVNQLRTCASFIVIDSGGGKPHGIADSLSYRFLPYSKLDKCFGGSNEGSIISKLKLAEQLLTLRRNEKGLV